MKASEFVFYYVNLFYYKCHKIKHNRGVSDIDSRDGIKNKKQQQTPSIKKIMPSIGCNSCVKS